MLSNKPNQYDRYRAVIKIMEAISQSKYPCMAMYPTVAINGKAISPDAEFSSFFLSL